MIYLFLDTEFTSFEQPELISIGIVSEDGQHEFYREVSDHNAYKRSQFVKDVVIPLLFNDYATSMIREYVAMDLNKWIDSLPTDQVTIVVDYPGDWHLVKPLLDKVSERRVKINAEMRNHSFLAAARYRAVDVSPEKTLEAMFVMEESEEAYFKTDPRQHHALVDARAMRAGWIAALEVLNGQQ